MAQPLENQKQNVRSQKVVDPNLEKYNQLQEEFKTRHAITIGKDIFDVYAFFRNFKNLPLFMKDLTAIHELSDTRTHWVVQIKSGPKVEWDAEISHEIPQHMIAWRSIEGSTVETSGSVHFAKAPGNRGTVVSLAMDYKVPGGPLTEFALFFTGESPEMLIMTNLKRLKAYLETGEIPTVEGQPSGRDEDSKTLKH